eukprot:scaffold137413_cov33-Prasinocladus_malaysianus.AAC.1
MLGSAKSGPSQLPPPPKVGAGQRVLLIFGTYTRGDDAKMMDCFPACWLTGTVHVREGLSSLDTLSDTVPRPSTPLNQAQRIDQACLSFVLIDSKEAASQGAFGHSSCPTRLCRL